MEKSKTYKRVKFPVEVIQAAYQHYLSKLDEKNYTKIPCDMSVKKEDELWNFDRVEEFLAAYSPDTEFRFDHIGDQRRFIISNSSGIIYIHIRSPDRTEIEEIFQIFEHDIEKFKIESEPPKVFIGHGNDNQWKLLKDHLQDYHKIEVNAYEIAPRAGISVKEVLEKMLGSSSIAFLVLTGEDIKNYDELHARENVIHELGLFQGKLGFNRGIILLEEGVTEFSNISGLTQIRFSKGNIRETFGDVLAVIKREFED